MTKFAIDKVGPLINVSIDDGPVVIVTENELKLNLTSFTRGQNAEILHKLHCHGRECNRAITGEAPRKERLVNG